MAATKADTIRTNIIKTNVSNNINHHCFNNPFNTGIIEVEIMDVELKTIIIIGLKTITISNIGLKIIITMEEDVGSHLHRIIIHAGRHHPLDINNIKGTNRLRGKATISNNLTTSLLPEITHNNNHVGRFKVGEDLV
jgi:hypothetical protein